MARALRVATGNEKQKRVEFIFFLNGLIKTSLIQTPPRNGKRLLVQELE